MANDLFSPSSIATTVDVLAKLGVGAVLGGIVGWEREMHGRPAGIRTHILVVLGVILFCEVSKAFSPNDQTRIAAQIVTGIGFLGAGTIMRNGAEVHGLTSAASVWAVSGIAMAVSVGGPFYTVAVVATVLTLLTLNVVEKLEEKLAPNLRPHVLSVSLEDRAGMMSLMEALSAAGGRVSAVRIVQAGPPVHVELTIQGNHVALMRAVASVLGLLDVKWNR